MKSFLLFFLSLLFVQSAFSQSIINYNDQELFLSGANLAWVNFANDIGPGFTDFERFADVMLWMHDHGGNTLRWWLHTNGSSTPEFNSADSVIAPGEGTIEDLRAILNLAWEREIGLKLCLWSFDMLRSSNSPAVLARNFLMLTDTNYTHAYINNALIPMVDSLKGHPAIIAWEIFNEPEGMSNEFGWSGVEHVPMSAIQRFINLCAGAIHRTDTSALVTSGAWSFQAMTDVIIPTIPGQLTKLSADEKEEIKTFINQKYNFSLTTKEVIQHLQKVTGQENKNYYSDSALVAEGGDPEGTLDFFSAHFYPHLGDSYSPFVHSKGYWNLNKAVVIGEFAMQENNNNIPKEDLFKFLYQFGYAGSLPWSWTDVNLSSPSDMLAGMQYMWDNYREFVDVNGISGDWPHITITSPENNSAFPDTTEIEITAEAFDIDGEVILVEFFVNDTLKIGEKDTIPYTVTWTDIEAGIYSLTAVATDDSGNQRTSNIVNIQVGTPPMTRLEDYASIRQGPGMSIVSDPTASGGTYLNIETNTETNTITWTLPNVPQAGTYEIKFGYRCAYDTPKDQFINVNGTRVDTIRFEGNTTTWLERGTFVDLVPGENTIQMQLWWGYMHLDYLAVPTNIVLTADDLSEIPKNFSLMQNYPNPFNPATTIRYSIPKTENVKIIVYDVLGRKVATLIDEEQVTGNYSISFDARSLSSGVYVYRIEAGSFSEQKKMMLLK